MRTMIQKDGEVTRNKIIEAIRIYRESHAYSPTVRELCSMVGLSSSSSVHTHLKILKKRGIIDYVESVPRTISIVNQYYFTGVNQEYESVG